MMSYLRRPLPDAIASIVGRVLIVYLFVGAANWHLRSAGWSMTLQDMQNHGVPAPAVLLVVAMAVSSAASFALLLDWGTKWAAYILAGYSILVSSLLHNPIHPVGADFFLFVKDLGIAGALLTLAALLPMTSASKD